MTQLKYKIMSKLIMLLVIIIIIIFSFCDNSKYKKLSQIQNNQLKTIKIPLNYCDVLQTDSIFENIEAICLETKDECLISDPQKVIVFDNKKIFVQDFDKNLLIFDINGKFISKVGKKGRGPGEYIQLAGFDIDSVGNIYILDYHKILTYNSDGIFKFSKVLNLSSKEYKITDSFLPIKHKVMNGFNRFKKYNDIYNIDPTFGNDTIYSITKKGLIARYYLDFGKRSLSKIKIPNEFESFSNFKLKLSTSYSFDTYRFTETNDWLYFIFNFNSKYYNTFYSKKLNKTFTSILEPDNSGSNKSFIKWIDTSWGNDLIVLVDPINVIAKLDDVSNLSSIDPNLKIKFKNIKLTDNPVLFICKMKKY